MSREKSLKRITQDLRRISSQVQFSRKEGGMREGMKEGMREGRQNGTGAKKYGTLHEFACHPCAGAMLIFSVSFQF